MGRLWVGGGKEEPSTSLCQQTSPPSRWTTWPTSPSLRPATQEDACHGRSPAPTCCDRTPGTPSSSVRRAPRGEGGARRGYRLTAPPAAPRMEPSSLENVLEPCAYAPTYVLKDFPIARYQGLQFVSAPTRVQETGLQPSRRPP